MDRRLRLTELCRVIRRLMDATRAAEDQILKVLLKHLALKAKRYEAEDRTAAASRFGPYRIYFVYMLKKG